MAKGKNAQSHQVDKRATEANGKPENSRIGSSSRYK